MILQFEPFHTIISPPFWTVLSKRKLDEIGLEQADIPINGFYTLGSKLETDEPPKLFLDEESLSPIPDDKRLSFRGTLRLFNTLDDFKAFDKVSWLKNADLGALDFFVVAFADLKKYKYYYHVCFPSVFSLSSPITVEPIEDADMADACLVVDDACNRKNVAAWNIRKALFLNPGVKRLVCKRNGYQVLYSILSCPEITPDIQRSGWERNSQGKIAPRVVDLSSTMDPVKLAEEAASLNLKLIKWRLLLTLDLNIFNETSCLLIGAGTLGCNVTRCLLAWGFRKITLVDNGRVSFSNPVRQSLFTHDDCLDGGRPKAGTAASRAREICPYAEVEGIDLSIPMPGHIIQDEDEFQHSCSKLDQLVQEHQVIFLLTDSRESRWLPALLGAAHQKLVITVALGFDSFVAMRHGSGGNHLGCYFCHDVNSPSDTLSGRTLDQQCTVTRPGLSYMASATAVELLASVLQHPLKQNAPASTAVSPTEPVNGNSSVLGLVPHQVRGFSSHFQNLILSGEPFDCCSACSPKVTSAYLTAPLDFLHRAIAEPDYLDEVSGLAELRRQEAARIQAFVDDLTDEDEDDF